MLRNDIHFIDSKLNRRKASVVRDFEILNPNRNIIFQQHVGNSALNLNNSGLNLILNNAYLMNKGEGHISVQL